jgi:hypothetical protein
MVTIELVTETTSTHAHSVQTIVVATVLKFTIVNEVIVKIVVAIIEMAVPLARFGSFINNLLFIDDLGVFLNSCCSFAFLFLLGLILMPTVLLYRPKCCCIRSLLSWS